MAITRYKFWGVGNKTNNGVTDSFNVGVHGIAKTNSPGMENVIINEYICQKLAEIICLPIPTGFIVNNGGIPYFVSLNFNMSGEDLPPSDPIQIVEKFPDLSAGIVLFDTWISNPDRHRQNIAHDTFSGQVQIFDHSHALLSNENIIEHLESNKVQANLGQHCLAPVLKNFDGAQEWNNRILQVPEYYIKQIFIDSVDLGLDASLVPYCVDYFLERRQQLFSLLKRSDYTFINLPSDAWAQII